MRVRAGLLASCCAACLLAAAAVAPFARADADPPSDVLIFQNVYYPYQPPVSRALSSQLDALTRQAQKAGFPIKVAIVASQIDLGALPGLFNKPQEYAKFLASEIFFKQKKPLLVVMPAGFAVVGVSGKAAAALRGLSQAGGANSDKLTEGAIAAVSKLAAASGHPLKGAKGSGSGKRGGSGGSPLLIFGVPLLLVLLAVGVATVRARRRESHHDGGTT